MDYSQKEKICFDISRVPHQFSNELLNYGMTSDYPQSQSHSYIQVKL